MGRRHQSRAAVSYCARSLPIHLKQHTHPYRKFSTPFLSACVGFLTNEDCVSGAIFGAILLSWVSEKFEYCFCIFIFFLGYFLKLKSYFASGLPQEFSGMLENQIERGRQEKRKPMCKITTDITY